jgi:M3 family oligoendopeptidase
VDVLTHEAGHAFESFTASKHQILLDMVWSTSEIDEIHSMSMEHFAYPWMESFFKDADKYRYLHLTEAFRSIPYLVCVDEFQHRVFEKPEMTADERYSAWRNIEKAYMPWRDYDKNEFLEKGGFWMQKQHIFLYPFYYVDYALAQVCAFQYYARMKKDRAKTWNDYYTLCCAGGSKSYFELLKVGSLENPFKEETVKAVAEDVMADLMSQKY